MMVPPRPRTPRRWLDLDPDPAFQRLSINHLSGNNHRTSPEMRHQRSPHRLSSAAIRPLFLLLLLLFPIFAFSRQFVLILSRDDFNDASSSSPSEGEGGDAASFHAGVESSNWDEFGDSESDSKLDPGSWLPILQSESDTAAFDPKTLHDANSGEALYFSGVRKMVSASSSGDTAAMVEGASDIEAAATVGHPAAQSALGFLYHTGQMRKLNRGKAFLYHFFAAESGNMQSKMALAYSYFRQNMHEKAVMLYAKLAEVAVKSFLVSEDSPVIESVRIHHGVEENKEELKKSRGEEDEDFQILEYQAHKGNALAMYKIGLFYYFGLRGLRLDHKKALSWFLKATEKGEPSSMEILGEIYARGAGVEKNYTKAYEWLKLAAQKKLYSAYNGLGFLYIKGYGVEQKNYTKAKEYFEIAALHEDAGGHYNLGVLYLKGIGVRKDVKLACKYFIFAANAGQPKAFYQLAKMFHTGVGLRRNIIKATALYKLVAERGPWSSLSRWALESYLKGDVGKAFLLYSRMAELGYEVAQSNSAWILDKYGDRSMCMGESGICTEIERHHRAHSLWWQASEQGNEHAALLIGDAYYYGRGTDRDYARAAEAYMHAKAQSNAQAMFNLGYMHEHGQGLPSDLHLAKRYYDQAQEIDPTAKLPVKLALTSLWIRKNYADSLLVVMIDSLPEVYPKVETWVKTVLLEEGNLTILTLSACLITVLYLREWQRRHVGAAAAGQVAAPHHPNELGAQALN